MAIDPDKAMQEVTEWCLRRIEESRRNLELFESGQLRLGRAMPGEEMLDETQRHVTMLRREIAELKDLLIRVGTSRTIGRSL